MIEHVVIDARLLGRFGIGTYLRELVPRMIRLRPRWRFTLLHDPRNETVSAWAGEHVRLVPYTTPIYTASEQWGLVRRIPNDATVYWAPHYNIPLLARVPLVVTIHDVCHLALPDLYGGLVRSAYARMMFSAVRRRARRVIFVSDFSRAEFRRLVGEPASATTVHNGVGGNWTRPLSASTSLPGPSDDAVEARAAVPGAKPFLLAIGSPKPHKNLHRVLLAFASIADQIEHDLVIVGGAVASRTADRSLLAAAKRLAPRVRLTTELSDDRLHTLMTGATALVFPSLYEGFGLPPLEAMASGCPCIVSSAASLPEVCADAAIYCDPNDVGDIAAKMRLIVGDPALRARLAAAGRVRAASFTWDRAAEQTVAALTTAPDIPAPRLPLAAEPPRAR